MPVKIGGWRRVLWLCSAAIALAACAVVRASNSCHSYSGNALLDRVDDHFERCLPPHASKLRAFTDALNTNELDATQRKPIAVVAISSSAYILDRFASSVATAVVGSSPTASAHAVRVLDMAEVATSPRAAHNLTQTMQHEMALALVACPQQRTLFLVRNLERVRGAKLPLLDVFLDPLNGERATLHDPTSGRDLDGRHALFVFLYKRDASDHVGSAWRDFLVNQWDQSAATSQLAADAFTPKALAGRLTTAFLFPDKEDEEDSKAGDAVWKNTCELSSFLARLKDAQNTRALGPWGDPLESHQWVGMLLGVAVLFVSVLIQAKWSVANSNQKAAALASANAKKNKQKQQKKKKKPLPSADHSRLASLRSHDHVVSTTVVEAEVEADVAPISPQLVAAVPIEDKSASPLQKTPPSAKNRKAKGPAPPSTARTTRQSERSRRK